MAWAVWAAALGRRNTHGRALLAVDVQGIVAVGSLAPALAAVLVRAWPGGEGFADAGLRPNLRRGWRGYLVAVVGPMAAGAATMAVATAARFARPDPSLTRAPAALGLDGGLGRRGPAPVIGTALVTAVVATPLYLGEEFGWRGYLQPRLPPGRPLVAAAATGLLWGAWHAPLALAGYGTFGQAPARFGLALYPLLCVPLSVVFGWVTDEAGSVWAACLAHAVHNGVTGYLLLALFAGDPNFARVTLLLAPAYGLVGVVLCRGVEGGGSRWRPGPAIIT